MATKEMGEVYLSGMLLVLKNAGFFPSLSQVTSHNVVMAKKKKVPELGK